MLKNAVGPQTAGLMMTNPSTCGVFEQQIDLIAVEGGELSLLQLHTDALATGTGATCDGTIRITLRTDTARAAGRAVHVRNEIIIELQLFKRLGIQAKCN